MTAGLYTFACNRCSTTASDTSRTGVELFTDHHFRTVHPLFAATEPPQVPNLMSRTPRLRRLVRRRRNA
jgi:hypothetical protein